MPRHRRRCALAPWLHIPPQSCHPHPEAKMERRGMSQAELRKGVQPASDGVGPLMQRDYWCVIRRCRFRSRALLSFVRHRFPRIPPEELARFEPSWEEGTPLEVGDELKIRIPGAGTVGVRVV